MPFPRQYPTLALSLLTLSLGCGKDGSSPNPPPTTGAIRVTTVTSGMNQDPDGYTVTVDGGTARAIGTNAAITVVGLSAGAHTTVLGAISANCTVSGGTSKSATVTAGDTTSVAFDISCTATGMPTGTISVTTTTTGTNPDPDGYLISVDGGAAQSIGVNATVSFSSVAVGSHTVALNGAALNCTSAASLSQTVPVTASTTTPVGFTLDCGTAPTGTIVFATDRDGQMEVYSVKPDGTGLTRLTSASQVDWYPALSPDGSKVIFESNRDGQYEIYGMDIDGSNQVNLTNDAAVDWFPAWSPDGSKIVFASTRTGGHLEIYVMNADGTGVTPITSGTQESLEPQWSPDGTTILFSRRAPATGGGAVGPSKLWTMNADGSGQAALLPTSTSNDHSAEYSPDGTMIVFITNRDGNEEVYRVNADGTGLLRLTTTAAREQVPSFSPNGDYIVFDTDRDGNVELYTMQADGTNQARFTNNPAQDFAADWGP